MHRCILNYSPSFFGLHLDLNRPHRRNEAFSFHRNFRQGTQADSGMKRITLIMAVLSICASGCGSRRAWEEGRRMEQLWQTDPTTYWAERWYKERKLKEESELNPANPDGSRDFWGLK